MRDSVTLEIVFPYWTAYRATLQLILYSPLQIALSSLFPLAGVYMLYLVVTYPHRQAPAEMLLDILLAVLGLLFTPLILALTLFLARRKNSFSQGPFQYTLDSSGVRAVGSTFDSTIKWPAIRRVVETRSFLFLFVAPARAISLPIAPLQSAGVLNDVREIVRKNRV